MSSHTPSSSSPALADYSALFRRQWWVVALGALIGLAVGLAYLAVAPKEYTSTASVMIYPISTDGSTTGTSKGDAVNVDTEAQLVKSVDVATKAQTQLGTEMSPTDLIQQVSITAPTNTTILQISFTAPTKAGARDGAKAFAEQYLANRKGTATATISAQVAGLEQQIKSYGQELAKYTAQTANPANADTPAYKLALAQADYTGGVIRQLNTQKAALLQISQNVVPGKVIQDAQLPEKASSPVKSVILASGLALGLLLGLCLAFWRERRDRRIHTAGQVERELRLPVLADLPRPARGQSLDALAPQKAPLGQEYVQLRNALLRTLESDHGSGGVALLVSRASLGTASGVATNLAAAVARAGSDVALVCADLEGSRVVDILGLPDGRGLSDVLTSGEPPAPLLRRPEAVRRMLVLTPGTDIEAAAERVETSVMDEIISTLRRAVGMVILEGPSSSEGADAQSLALHAEGVVILVEAGRTRIEEVADAVRQYERTEATVLGVVLMPRLRRRDRHVRLAPPAPTRRRTPPVEALPVAGGSRPSETVAPPVRQPEH
jgi:uncharacterized protein involved in exopolysaccharide biosynthesis/Mrp family chromosome partitioning ATPase